MTATEIRGVRRFRGLTQVQFARLLGVHPQTASKWERNLLTPTEWQLALLSRLAVKSGPRGRKLRELIRQYDPAVILTTKLSPR